MADPVDTELNHEALTNARDWPAYPMRKESGDEHAGMNWQRPPQQAADVEVLHSNERPNLSATFGTTLPPSGLSGVLRRFAFRFSESNGAHWITLILADRINVVEGLFDDLRRGHVPNIPGEMGLRSDLKYNPAGLAIKTGVTALVVIGLAAYLTRRRPKRRHR